MHRPGCGLARLGLICLAALASGPAIAETVTAPIPPSITTPATVETGIGPLQFPNGVPTAETAQKVYDQLDLQRGIASYLNGLRGVSIFAARKGIREAGVADNDVLIFSKLMDSRSLFLTANADTVYFFTNLDLTQGAARGRDAARHARALRRSVVPLGHRLRHAGARSRRGRQVSAAAARLRRAAARRLFHRAPDHDLGRAARARLPRRRQAGAGRRRDQEDAQDLSLRARLVRHQHRQLPHRQGAARPS